MSSLFSSPFQLDIEWVKARLPPRLLKLYQKISLGGKRATLGYGLALLVLGGLSTVSYQNATQIEDVVVQVRQTQFQIKDLSHLAETLSEADYRRSNYYMFAESQELQRYRAAVEDALLLVFKLQQSFQYTGDGARLEQLNYLDRLIEQRTMLGERSIAQFQREQVLPTLQDPTIAQLRQNHYELHQWMTALQVRSEQILQNQIAQTQNKLQARMLMETVGTLFTFLILIGVYWLLHQQHKKRQQAENTQQMLAHANEMVSLKLEFFSLISHEFRTPLSSVLGAAQLLEESIRSIVPPEKLKNLHRIQSSAKLLTQMLSDILTISRANAGKLDCERVPVEMQSFCLNLVEDFQVFLDQKQAIQFVKYGSATHAKIDERLVYSILSNLLSNALKYSPPGRAVQLTLICEPEVVKFQVSDQGIGILPQDQEMLYEPFRRGMNTTNISGTGLGLVVVKKCVELHHGEISVQSQVGVGTTFTVTLPQMGELQRITPNQR
jgi:signal transduction histidine kinase